MNYNKFKEILRTKFSKKEIEDLLGNKIYSAIVEWTDSDEAYTQTSLVDLLVSIYGYGLFQKKAFRKRFFRCVSFETLKEFLNNDSSTYEELANKAAKIDFSNNEFYQKLFKDYFECPEYIFDRKRCILGSANLTNRGLGLSFHGNYELSSFADVDDVDLRKIDILFDNAILMTDELYETMKSEYQEAKKAASTAISTKWSSIIENRFNPKIDLLFTYDFPTTAAPDFDDISTFEFLGLGYIPSINDVRQAFRWSKAFLWLYNYVSSCPNKTSYFGGVTASLHNALINDPKPYRKEVKDLLANTLGWIQALNIDDIVVDIPNYSQRIRVNV